MGHKVTQYLLELGAYPQQWASDFSAEICVTAAQDTIAPVAPTGVTATAKLERIQVGWTNPTTNVDGSACTDLSGVNVYYASAATHASEGSIDIDDSDTYDGVIRISAEEWPHNVAAGAQYYYVVTAVDRTENEGVASSEVNATALTVGDSTDVPDDATGLIFDAIAIGDGILLVVTNVPTATWVGFSYYRLWYSVKNGSWGAWVEIGPIGRYGYTHKNLDTTKVYKYKATVVGEGTDNESSTADTIDNSGAGYQPNAVDNSAIGAILIAAQTIVGIDEVRAPNITCDNLAAINANLGAVTAGSIVVGTTNKIWLNEGIDGILAIGGATKASAPFRVAATGALTSTDIAITGGTLNINSGVFTVSAAGAATCSNLTITGGSIDLNSGVFSVSAAGAVVATSVTITGNINADQTSNLFHWVHGVDPDDSNNRAFTGATPNTWTDLDLSTWVGAQACLVLLLVKNLDATWSANYNFRPNGAAFGQHLWVDDYPGVFGTRVADVQDGPVYPINWCWCITDTSGVIEWMSSEVNDASVYCMAYLG